MARYKITKYGEIKELTDRRAVPTPPTQPQQPPRPKTLWEKIKSIFS